MNTWTRVGLVLLRIAIGWHFLFEGLDKLDSRRVGPREGKLAWSARGYLSEAQGPLAWWFRQQAGQPDKIALAKLTLPDKPGKLPPEIEGDWQRQFDRFVAHYELGKANAVQPEYVGLLALAPAGPFPAAIAWPALVRTFPQPPTEKAQLALAKADLAAARQRALWWFSNGLRTVSSKLPGVDEKLTETTPQRISRYRKTLETIQEIETVGMPAFDKDVWKENYRASKKAAATQRADLLRDLDAPFENVLTVAKFRLSSSQRDKGPPPAEAVTSPIDRIDFVTSWGLTIVGACLLLGLFTRTACVTAAAFLLMVYLAMPPLPWLPANPRAEGHYQFVDKNLIEMLALFVLATTANGKWLGLDGLVQFLNPFRRRPAV